MTSRSGVALIEVVIVLGLVAAISGLWWAGRPHELPRYAMQLANALTSARSLAAVSGETVAVHGRCMMMASPHYGPASVSGPPSGLLFTPDGLPRTCDGGGVGNTTILLEHRGRQAAVIVSSLGRVRWERR